MGRELSERLRFGAGRGDFCRVRFSGLAYELRCSSSALGSNARHHRFCLSIFMSQSFCTDFLGYA